MSTATDSRPDPAAFPAEAGRVWLNRILLEAKLSSVGAPDRWKVIDRRTGTVHLLELLPPDRITRLSDAERQLLLEPFIHGTIPGLLSHCRLEGAWPHYASLSAFDPRLTGPTLASPETRIPDDATQAMRHLFAIGGTLIALQEQGLRAHAAVTPECLWLPAQGDPLLAGYPFSLWGVPEPTSPFLSPQRRQGAAPDPSDDIYSLGALGVFLLSGGTLPAATGQRIDELRQQRRLAPTGWKKGWDEPLTAALGGVPSLRPASARALLERLSQSTGVPLSPVPAATSPLSGKALVSRRRPPPSWRLAKRPDLSATPAADPTAAPARESTGSPVASWVELRQQQSELELQKADLERRARLLAEDIARAASRRTELSRLDEELERNQAEYNTARLALDEALDSHTKAKTALQSERAALDAERQRVLSEEAAAKAAWEARKKALDAQQASNEARLAEFKQREADLNRRSEEQGQKETSLAESSARLQKERLAWLEEQAEAERQRQARVESAQATPATAPSATPEPTPAAQPDGISEEVRLALAKLDAVEAQRDRLETELSALKSAPREDPALKARVEELAGILQARDAELARQNDQLQEWKRAQERQQASLAESRSKLDEERAALQSTQDQLEKDRAAWQDEVRRKTAEFEAAERARKKSPKPTPAPKTEPKVEAPETPRDGKEVRPPEPARSKAALLVGVAGAVIAAVLGFLMLRYANEASRLRDEAAARTQPTTLVVVTDPLGADVSLAGQPSRPSPARFDQVRAGPVQVRVTKDGYRPLERTFEVVEGRTLVSDPITLNPVAPAQGPTGWLYVRTRPIGAQVTRIGSPPVTAPTLLQSLPAGPVRLTVRLEGYLPVERTVDIKAGEDSVLDLTLQPAPPPKVTGALRITTEPAGADIRVEGMATQASPARFENLNPGRVRVTVTKDGYEPLEQTVEVRGGETTAVPVLVLKPKPVPTAPPKVTSAPSLTLPKDLTLTAGGKELKLLRVDSGEVNLGDAERGRVKVLVTRPFLMADGEVTQAVYSALMADNPSAARERKVAGPSRTIMEDYTTTVMSGGRPTSVTQKRPKVIPGEEVVTPLLDNPVENVTWEQAVDFCRRLTRAASAQGALPAGTVVRLPTETEWELAQRRGADWAGANARAALERFAWVSEGAEGGHHAIRTKQAGTTGLFDLDGNVAEWCLDAWSTQLPPESTNDPVVLDAAQQTLLGVPAAGTYTVQLVTDAFNRRVVRGGSWRTPAGTLLNQPVRLSQPARADDVGFRVVVATPVGTASPP